MKQAVIAKWAGEGRILYYVQKGTKYTELSKIIVANGTRLNQRGLRMALTKLAAI